MDEAAQQNIGQRMQILRKRCGLSIRQLAGEAGVTPGIISCIERDKSSPSIATLQKILAALGTDLRTFFGGEQDAGEGPVIAREQMKLVSDGSRSYTIVFPKRADINVEMLDETHRPGADSAEFEKLDCDVAGYVLSGTAVLEVKGEKKKIVRTGDAFYVPKGTEHRGYVSADEPARIITVYTPTAY